MKLHDAATHLFGLTNATYPEGLEARRPHRAIVSASATNADVILTRNSSPQEPDMDIICTDSTNKKRSRSHGDESFIDAVHFSDAAEHYCQYHGAQQTKKRPRTVCADTKHNTCHLGTPGISMSERVDPQVESKHLQFSLKHRVDISTSTEHYYEWRCSHAAVLISISNHWGLCLRPLQGVFQSTPFVQVRGNEILWTLPFATTSLEHVGRCLVAAVVNMSATHDAENYLLPGRFRLGYEEESSMLIS